jgi:predicted transcriptional regulator
VGVQHPKSSIESQPQPLWLKLKLQGAGAGDLLQLCQVEEPPVDVRAIAHQLGIRLHDVPQPGWSGAVKSSLERADIWVKANEIEHRQRFTIAHELGHLMLHELGEEYRDVTFAGSRKETAANRFAADLLMPLWMLSREADRFRGSSDLLAARFKVSEQAMKIRLSLL